MSVLPQPVNPYQSPQEATENGSRPRVFTQAALVRDGLVVAFPFFVVMLGLPTCTVLACHAWGSEQPAALILAAVGSVALVIPAVLQWQNVAEALPYRRMKRRLAAWWRERGVDVAAGGGMFVELGVASEPRVYHFLCTNLDIGFVFLTPDRLVYLGDLATFSIERTAVRRFRVGPTGVERQQPDCIFIDWQPHGETGTQTFWLGPAEAGTLRANARLTGSMLEALERWRAGEGTASLPAEWAAPPPPEFATVPSKSARGHAVAVIGLIALSLAGALAVLALDLDVEPLPAVLFSGVLLSFAGGFSALHSPARLVAVLRSRRDAIEG